MGPVGGGLGLVALAGIIAPVFAIILMGAAAPRFRLIDAAGLRGLNDFAFYAALPSLLFMSVAETPEIRLLDVGGIYFAAALGIYAVGMVLAWRPLRMGVGQAAAVGLNASFGNTVMLGIPIVAAAFGREGVALLLAIIALHSVIMLPFSTVLIESGQGVSVGIGGTGRRILESIARNPVILAILLALLWRATGLPLSDPIHRLLTLLGGCGPALALFCLGASLPPVGGAFIAREILLATVLKLLLMPALVAGLGLLFNLQGLAFQVAVLTAALPTGANAFLVARRTATLMESAAGTVVVSTALSLLTLSAALFWLR